MKYILMLVMILMSAVSLSASDVIGYWKGEVATIPIIFHVFEKDSGLVATLDSPSQGAKDIPCEKISQIGDSVIIDMSLLRASFRGKITPDGNTITGFFTQGATLPLILTRTTEDAMRLNRPQEPRPPFMYNSREVTFSHDGVTLAGTLTTPLWGRKFPAVVLVSGSGAQNRDEEIMGHKPFAVIADKLSRSGIAVLRYDDRGVGSSSRGTDSDTTLDFAQDAIAAIDFLKSQPDVDLNRIGVIGHSEGGTIAFICAAERPNDVAFVVSLAGMSVKGKDMMVMQNKMISELAHQPLSPEKEKNITLIFDAIDTSGDRNQLSLKLKEIMSTTGAYSESEISRQIAQMTTPWYISLIKLDPSQYISKIKCPLLALNGDWDVQVNAQQNMGAIKALKLDAETKIYPMVNHMFQEAPSFEKSFSYGAIDQTISPTVLNDITTWIVNQVVFK